jgi:peptide-methionine (S)-S-oxide reductase
LFGKGIGLSLKKIEKATLGDGCFSCLEPILEDLIGVDHVVPGYAGGSDPNPSYKEMCSSATGHAEVMQIGYAPQQISFRLLLEIFFSVHDPTMLNMQGADVGSQYRSSSCTTMKSRSE